MLLCSSSLDSPAQTAMGSLCLAAAPLCIPNSTTRTSELLDIQNWLAMLLSSNLEAGVAVHDTQCYRDYFTLCLALWV